MNRGDRVDVIANVRIGGEGRELLAHPDVERDGRHDVWLADGRIADIAPAGAIRRRGAVLDADGAWLVPGLWDHHVHTRQEALRRTRTSLAAAATAEEAAQLIASAEPDAEGRRVGMAARCGLWAQPPSLAVLDEATGDTPAYVVNADLHSAWLNSAALRREGIDPLSAPDGMVREPLAFEIAARLHAISPEEEAAAIARLSREAAARGLVGVWDLEIADNAARWRRLARAHDGVRVWFDVYPAHLDEAIADGLATGDLLDGRPPVGMGMLKVIADGSLGTRTAATSRPYPAGGGRGTTAVDAGELVGLITRAAGAGIATTVHAIGDVTAAMALDAFAAADVPGRIEHAQLVAHADVPRFARLDIEASIQPRHALDDRELVARDWRDQTAIAYPMRELADAGASVLLGSDAPVSSMDPWIQLAAAVFRADEGEEPWRPEQRLDARRALAASTRGGTGDPATIEPGSLADLVVVAHDPLAAAPAQLRAMPVHATLVGGVLTHLS